VCVCVCVCVGERALGIYLSVCRSLCVVC